MGPIAEARGNPAMNIACFRVHIAYYVTVARVLSDTVVLKRLH